MSKGPLDRSGGSGWCSGHRRLSRHPRSLSFGERNTTADGAKGRSALKGVAACGSVQPVNVVRWASNGMASGAGADLQRPLVNGCGFRRGAGGRCVARIPVAVFVTGLEVDLPGLVTLDAVDLQQSEELADQIGEKRLVGPFGEPLRSGFQDRIPALTGTTANGPVDRFTVLVDQPAGGNRPGRQRSGGPGGLRCLREVGGCGLRGHALGASDPGRVRTSSWPSAQRPGGRGGNGPVNRLAGGRLGVLIELRRKN